MKAQKNNNGFAKAGPSIHVDNRRMLYCTRVCRYEVWPIPVKNLDLSGRSFGRNVTTKVLNMVRVIHEDYRCRRSPSVSSSSKKRERGNLWETPAAGCRREQKRGDAGPSHCALRFVLCRQNERCANKLLFFLLFAEASDFSDLL